MAERPSLLHTLSRVASTEGHPTFSTPPSPSESSLSTTSHGEHDLEKAVDEKVEPVASKDDPNLVDWNGPDDPEKPLNWSKKKKWVNMMLIATLTILTPFGSSMFAPGVPDMMEEFHSTNVDLASFVVSIYVLGYVMVSFCSREPS